MKKWMLSLVLVFLVAGCNEDMTARLGELVTTSRVLIEKVEGYQVASTGIVSALESAGLVDAEMVAKLEKLNAEIDKVQPQVASIADAIDKVEPTDDATMAIVNALQAANAASTPFNPYAVPIGSGLAILSTILGLFAKKKTDEAKAATLKNESYKIGINKTLMGAESATEKVTTMSLYNNIGEARARLGVT